MNKLIKNILIDVILILAFGTSLSLSIRRWIEQKEIIPVVINAALLVTTIGALIHTMSKLQRMERAWVLKGEEVLQVLFIPTEGRGGGLGYISILPEGILIKPPPSGVRDLLRSKVVSIPWERVKRVRIVERALRFGKKGLFIELEFLDQEGRKRIFMFAATGIMGIRGDETEKLYREILAKTQRG